MVMLSAQVTKDPTKFTPCPYAICVPIMDFLREPLSLSVAAEHSRNKHTCFAADIFSDRPPFEQIVAWRECARKLEDAFSKLMGRKTCPLAWLAMFIDAEGATVLVHAKRDIEVNNMRQALGTALAPLPKEQQTAISDTLRPRAGRKEDRRLGDCGILATQRIQASGSLRPPRGPCQAGQDAC